MTDVELHHRLLYLTNLLDQLGHLWFMKLDLKRFFGDSKVRALGHYAHAYLFLLARMWENGGFVSANDRVVARLLDLDVTVWRRTYKPRIEPMLQRLPDAALGEIFTQKTLVDLMIEQADLRIANKDKTRAATEARTSRKSKQRRPVTSTVTSNVTKTRNDERNDAATEHVTVGKLRSSEENRALPLQAESPIPPTGQGLGAPSGEAEAAAQVASPSLEGGLLPPPTPALLRSRIVKGNGHGTATEPAPERGGAPADPEPLPEPQGAERTEPAAVGLFGLVEAAERKKAKAG